ELAPRRVRAGERSGLVRPLRGDAPRGVARARRLEAAHGLAVLGQRAIVVVTAERQRQARARSRDLHDQAAALEELDALAQVRDGAAPVAPLPQHVAPDPLGDAARQD